MRPRTAVAWDGNPTSIRRVSRHSKARTQPAVGSPQTERCSRMIIEQIMRPASQDRINFSVKIHFDMRITLCVRRSDLYPALPFVAAVYPTSASPVPIHQWAAAVEFPCRHPRDHHHDPALFRFDHQDQKLCRTRRPGGLQPPFKLGGLT